MEEDHRRETDQRIRSQERAGRFPELGNAERRSFQGSRYGVAGAAHPGVRPQMYEREYIKHLRPLL